MAKKSRAHQMLERAVSYFFTEPATTKYPDVKPQLSDSFRGQMIFDIQLCTGCGLCSRDCPSKAIEMVEFDRKRHPQFRLDKYIFCYQCAETCPKKAIAYSSFYELATTDKASLIMKPQPILMKIET